MTQIITLQIPYEEQSKMLHSQNCLVPNFPILTSRKPNTNTHRLAHAIPTLLCKYAFYKRLSWTQSKSLHGQNVPFLISLRRSPCTRLAIGKSMLNLPSVWDYLLTHINHNPRDIIPQKDSMSHLKNNNKSHDIPGEWAWHYITQN
jgi:hypothetical protein